MVGSENIHISVPRSRLQFRASRAALGLILATTLLAIILTFSTLENINRSQTLMEGFLLEKGEAIIRSIEAGSRTSLMHHMGKGDPLHTLLEESSREQDIIFIRIMDQHGDVIDQAGTTIDNPLSPESIAILLGSGQPLGMMDEDNDIFIISKSFETSHQSMPMDMMNSWHKRWMERSGHNNLIISIGLHTSKFAEARRQDVRHAMFMGAILFLTGSAGLYFLFLYQGVRVARSTLADMQLYTDSVIESIPVSLITLDAENKIVSGNKNTETLLGKPLDTVTGKHIGSALPGCSICLEKICNDSFDHSAECTNAHGKQLPVQISCSSLVNHDGESIGKVLIIRDMTTIRDMEIQLERSRRMAALGKMAAGIAHEIRNPLGTLRGFAQFFGSQAQAQEEKEYAELMVSEVDRLNQTVSGLLQFARPREPQLQTFALDGLLQKISALMKADFEAKEIDYSCQSDSAITLTADPDLLLQVLMNLLKNSIHATPSQGKISLIASQREGNIRITVNDSGKGMSEEEREKMFDPFFTTGKTGTGLGLTVSHQIIEQHKGSIEVETAPGQGTSITCILPATL